MGEGDGSVGPGAEPAQSAADGPDLPAIEDPEERSLARRLSEQRAALEDKISTTYERLQDARPRSSTIDTAFRALERDGATGGGVLSAAVAFRVFLFMIPYVFVLIVGFGVAADASGSDSQDAARSAGIGGLVAQSLKGVGDLSGWSRVTALFFGLFALYLSSRGLVKVLRISHGLIWRVRIPKLQSGTKAAGVLVGLVTVILGTIYAVSVLRERSVVLSIVLLGLMAVIPAAVWLLVTLLLPHADCPWWALAPGAGVFGVGVLGLHAATIYWFSYEVSKKSETYGAIGMSLAFLLWAYILGRIITAAASISAAFWYRNEERLGHAVPEQLDIEERLSAPAPTAESVVGETGDGPDR
jgi:uncharacterized BrkB/YihY/UPF0761 family membrane protein